MTERRRSRKIWIFSIIVVIGVIILFSSTDQPPESHLELARNAISSARSTGAGKYASQYLEQAESLYEEALNSWATENTRLRFLRDYEEARTLAQESSEVALIAGKAAKIRSGRLKTEISNRLDSLNLEINRQELTLRFIPLSESLRQMKASASLKFKEAQLSCKEGNFPLAMTQLHQAEHAYKQFFNEKERILESYFTDFEKWQKWSEETIKSSRKNQKIAIIIDKIGHTCDVYSNGKIIHTYPVELGIYWLGDKKHQGDQTTPEGQYFITAKKTGNQTIYHRALLINYPNKEDQHRFALNSQNKMIPEGKDIGSLIELHGEGGKGFDWTNGCIAFTNSDIEKLYKTCSVGTPVTIIGSHKTIEELLNESIP